MEFQYHPYDIVKSAMKLSTDALKNGTSLRALINEPGFFACFARSPSGQPLALSSFIGQLTCALLPDGTLMTDRWVTPDPHRDLQVLFSRRQDKTLAVDGSLYRYTVFSYRVNGSTVEMYESDCGRPAQKPYRDITMTVTWSAVRYRRPVRRLFRRGETEETAYFAVSLESDDIEHYEDGLITCTSDRFTTPVTVEMLRAGGFYVRAGAGEPELTETRREKIYLKRKR